MSVVDYVLLKASDLSSVNDFKILDDSIFSDHRCLYFTLLKKHNKRSSKKFSNNYVNKIVFDRNKEEIFVQLIQENIDDFNRDVDQSEATGDQVEILSKFLSKHAKTVFKKKKKKKTK